MACGRCTQRAAEEVNIEGVPDSLDEALYNSDVGQTRSNVLHQQHSDRDGKVQEIPRGRGTKMESAKVGLLPYFQRVDRGLHRYLHAESAPLVLATVEYLVPICREANRYTHLIDEAVLEYPDRMSGAELRDMARPHVRRRRRGAARRPPGQVQYLFVDLGREGWGTFDRQGGATRICSTWRRHSRCRTRRRSSRCRRSRRPTARGVAAICWLPLGQRRPAGDIESGVKVGAG